MQGKERTLSGTGEIAPKKGFNLKKVAVIGGSLVTIAAAAAGGVAIVKNILSSDAIPDNRPAHIFEPGKMDSMQQLVNARQATSEQVQNFLNGPKLEMPQNIESPDQLPTLPVMYTVGVEQAGEIRIWREKLRQPWNGKLEEVPIYLKISVQNPNTPEGLILLGNVNTDEVQIFLAESSTFSGETLFTTLYEKFDLGNGGYALLETTADKSSSLKATDIMKNAPVLLDHVEEGLSYADYVRQQTGRKVSMLENPSLFTTVLPNTTTTTNLFIVDATNNSFMPLLTPETQNGSVFLGTPTSTK